MEWDGMMIITDDAEYMFFLYCKLKEKNGKVMEFIFDFFHLNRKLCLLFK